MDTTESTSAPTSARPILIFACSGAADVGLITDRAGRKLTREGAGRMFCLAGVGGGVPGILETTASAAGILAIDGCPTCCAKHCLEEAGFRGFDHVQLADLGLCKGESPATDENIATVCAAARSVLAS